MYNQVVTSRTFYTAYFIFVFLSFFPQYWQASFKSIGQFYEQTDAFMTAAASISLIGNMSSRLLTGMAVDRFGFKATTMAIAITSIIFGSTYDMVGHIPICFAIWLFVS